MVVYWVAVGMGQGVVGTGLERLGVGGRGAVGMVRVGVVGSAGGEVVG